MLSRKRGLISLHFIIIIIYLSRLRSLPLSWLDFSLMTKPFTSSLHPPTSLIPLAIYVSTGLFALFSVMHFLQSLILNLHLLSTPSLSFFASFALTSLLFFTTFTLSVPPPPSFFSSYIIFFLNTFAPPSSFFLFQLSCPKDLHSALHFSSLLSFFGLKQ